MGGTAFLSVSRGGSCLPVYLSCCVLSVWANDPMRILYAGTQSDRLLFSSPSTATRMISSNYRASIGPFIVVVVHLSFSRSCRARVSRQVGRTAADGLPMTLQIVQRYGPERLIVPGSRLHVRMIRPLEDPFSHRCIVMCMRIREKFSPVSRRSSRKVSHLDRQIYVLVCVPRRDR